MNQVKKNYIYNIMYQLLVLILPLVTVPYVSRVLGADGVGIYSYTYSIVYYFVLIAMLGINNYGNRTIAKVSDDKIKISRSFFSIYLIQFIMSIIMIILYILFIMLFSNEYKTIGIIQGIYLIATMFDVNWFFFGIEKFKLTVTRNTIIKVLSLIGIFVFVKDENDVALYTVLLAGSTLVSNLLLIPFLLKEINFVRVDKNSIKKHIKPILVLFIPVIAVSLYKIMDKIMIGLLSNISEVGYYEQAEKIINVPTALVTALGTVMLPRISNLLAKGENKRIKDYIEKSITFIMFLAFPIWLGLIAISSDFAPIFLGDSFVKSGHIINYISIIVVFISFANVIRTQYLIPNEKDKIYVLSVVFGAVINLIINFLLIPKFEAIGAAIGTILAELFVAVYQSYSIRKELPINNYLKMIFPFLVKSFLMFFIVCVFKFIDMLPIWRIVLQIVCGVGSYLIFNYKYLNSLIDLRILSKKAICYNYEIMSKENN